MHSLSRPLYGLKKREKSKLWFKSQEYKTTICGWKKKISVAQKNADKQQQLKYTFLLAETYYSLELYAHVIDYSKRCIDIAKLAGDRSSELKACFLLVKTYDVLKKYNHKDVIHYSKRCIELAEEIKEKKYYLKACYLLVKAYGSLNQYDSAVIYAEKYLHYAKETGDKESEIKAYHLLILACDLLEKYDANTVLYCQKCIDITEKTGDKKIKLKSCLILVKTYEYLHSYDEVDISYFKKCLDILEETGNNTQSKMKACYLLVKAYGLLKHYDDAVPYIKRYIAHQTCVDIAHQTYDKKLTKTYLLFGKVYYSLNQYPEAIVYFRKCTRMEFVGKQEEIDAYSMLVEAQYCLEDYDNAITNGKTCIRRAQETNQENGLTNVYYFLGIASYYLKEYDDAIDYCKKCIKIAKQNSDKSLEIEGCLLLAKVFYERKRHNDAIAQSEKCVHIASQKGDKLCEMKAYLLIGRSYFSLECYEDANCNIKKCIKMAQETGHLKFELEACVFNARLFLSIGNVRDLVSAIAQSLVLAEELCDSPAKQSVVEILFDCLEKQEHDGNSMTEFENCSPEANQTLEREVNLGREIGTIKKIENLIVLHERYIQQVRNDELVEAIATLKQMEDVNLSSMEIFLKSFCRQRIGCLYLDVGQSEEGISQLCDAMSYAKKVGSSVIENKIVFKCSRILGVAYLKNGKTEKSISFLRASISCIDFFVKTMEADENTIIDFIDKVNDCYNYLAKGLIKKNRIQEALLVLEQRTARALKEQLISRHEIKTQQRHEEHITYQDIISLISKNKYAILFCSVFSDCLYTFLIEEGSDVQFRQFPSPRTDTEKSIETMLESFAINKKNRTLTDMDSNIIAHENNTCNVDQDISKTVGRILAYFGSSSCSRTPKEPCENVDIGSITNDLDLLYHKLFGKMSIEQDEIVIIPDGPLYKVPFAALRDPDTGRYLSETKRIRIAPSITTLKLLQEIPVDQSKNPALVVGNPLVGEVMLDGEMKNVRPLSAAFREANAVSSILNVMPLIGENATKPAVLEQLQREVSVVHIAAHGCFNNGTIALAPTPEIRGTKIPDEADYMLTMGDVKQAQVRVPFVVLSCCETGRGEIKAEGVVGMCRAFLVSGARAVVASLWAIHDQATSEFMKTFHQHLKAGESASTSLQHTMNEMRQIQKYRDPKYWAPFFLLGDDVTIN